MPIDIASAHWHVECYPSGTMIVRDLMSRKELYKYGVRMLDPWLYVYGPKYESDENTSQARFNLCCQLADFLNGGIRPAWLDDVRRVSEDRADDLDGTSIQATGPMIDASPPRCVWTQDDSPEACDARARLLDVVFGIRSTDHAP